MPPLRVNLPLRPTGGAALNTEAEAGIPLGGRNRGRPQLAGRDGTAAGTVVVAAPSVGASPWPTWPLVALSTVHTAVKGWFARMDAALLELPRGLGPAVSTLVRYGLRYVIRTIDGGGHLVGGGHEGERQLCFMGAVVCV